MNILNLHDDKAQIMEKIVIKFDYALDFLLTKMQVRSIIVVVHVEVCLGGVCVLRLCCSGELQAAPLVVAAGGKKN